MKLFLSKPDLRYENAFYTLASDYEKVGETRYQCDDGWNHNRFKDYVQKLNNQSEGKSLKPGYVPGTTYWLICDDSRIVGVSRLRHYLVDHLKKEGGHIGYDVPPSCRDQGFGTRLLSLTLDKAKEMDINRVLITCDKDNIASCKIIENNSGVLAGTGISDRTGKEILRYWIETQK